MNPAGVLSLSLRTLRGDWCRAVLARYLAAAMSTSHTRRIRSRFFDSSRKKPGPRVLYLAENPAVALFELQALYGSPLPGGTVVANPGLSVQLVNVRVDLQHVADFTVPAETNAVATTTEELTGDWRGYHDRAAFGTVPAFTGIAPTQELGEALVQSGAEGVISVSARLPIHRILAIFPDNLRPASQVTYDWRDPATGLRHHGSF